jgi:hypothetical protein
MAATQKFTWMKNLEISTEGDILTVSFEEWTPPEEQVKRHSFSWKLAPR